MQTPQAPILSVDFYADLTCPWCLIGRRRLQQALSLHPGLTVAMHWRAYRLHPTLPPRGAPERPPDGTEHDPNRPPQFHDDGRTDDDGRAGRIRMLIEQTAAREGLALNLDRIRHVPATLSAHRLVRLAAMLDGAPRLDGAADRLAQAVLAAHLVHGRDIGDQDELLAIWRDQGLPTAHAAALLAGEEGARAVLLSDIRARQNGIRALPTLVFQNRYAVTGAQDAETLLPLIGIAAGADGGTAGTDALDTGFF